MKSIMLLYLHQPSKESALESSLLTLQDWVVFPIVAISVASFADTMFFQRKVWYYFAAKHFVLEQLAAQLTMQTPDPHASLQKQQG
jgi:hypothetical protein